MRDMKILCITDQFEGSDHSSIEGIFGKYLQKWCEVSTVYFISDSASGCRRGDKIYIPYRHKRHGLMEALRSFVPMETVDFVIVRNFFPVLREIHRGRKAFKYRVGFWHSFPHTFRRLFEAKKERRAVVRKTLEYKLRKFCENKLISKCDFLITMSNEFKNIFYADQDIDHLALPMGVSFENAHPHVTGVNEIRKFLYTGTVDHLRETDTIVKAFSELDEDFEFHIFTRSDNAVTRYINNLGNPKIRLYPAVPRTELFQKMVQFDIGVGLIPENSLYDVSSPTKTLEYYSVGLPALINYLPEYLSLFDNSSAFFCNFSVDAIGEAVRAILRAPNTQLLEMGKKGESIVKEKRDYRILSETLYDFLKHL